MVLHKRCGKLVHCETESCIQKEIYNAGPMETGFTVYPSFMSYKTGIYHPTKSDWLPQGGHAVKVIGWGEENGTKYWICSNSWGNAWGEDGFFRIKKGVCGIDDELYACTITKNESTEQE